MRFAASSSELSEAAMDAAHRMRALMRADIEELELADRITAMNEELNRDAALFDGAWRILAASERRAWKTFLTLRQEHEREHY